MRSNALTQTPDVGSTKFLSVQDAARRYSVTPRSIWRWVREGGFPAPIQLGSGGATRFVLAELEDWESRKRAQRGEA
ncbi:MAG: helix-turn-helix domain-containing protein [Gammaproteobacteria bacterium]|nr:helix-turn-helix domain-containing protein [Gammaproteobacteria bacterium]